MEKSETMQLFFLINNAYDMFDVNEEKVDLWANLLADQELSDVLENFKAHTLREKYPPSIADLRGVPSYSANTGYLDKGAVLRLEGMKKEAIKRIPEDAIPDFIKKGRD